MVAVEFLVLLIATIFQGSFGICFKKYRPFSWEAFWALFSIIGVLLMPHIWCAILIPDYFSYLSNTPMAMLILKLLNLLSNIFLPSNRYALHFRTGLLIIT